MDSRLPLPYEIIYYKHDNPNKQKFIKAFNELMSQDIYEIVI